MKKRGKNKLFKRHIYISRVIALACALAAASECNLIASGPLRYPPKAKRYRYVGQVIVKFGISPDGKVVNPFVAESEPPGVFERAALMHVKSWRYQAPRFEGSPVTVDEVAVRLVFDPKRR